MTAPRPRVEQTRGDCVEGVHPFSAVAVRDGQIVGVLGEPAPTTFRSAAKPFQLAVALGLLGDPELDDAELAVGAASHSAEPVHLDVVRGLLARFGLDASGLRCGAHPPVHVPSAEAELRAGGTYSDLHNNCSGKHTFMLAASRAQGWDPDYRPCDHPLQVRNAAQMAAWAGTTPGLAVDGCGVPTFCLPLESVAQAWATLAAAMAGVAPGEATGDLARLGRVGLAMARRPDLTSGTGRLDVDVVAGGREPLAVKVGAMGLFCLAFPERRTGVAVKIRSGSGDVLGPAIEAALQVLVPGAWQRPARWPWATVRNVVGREVGEVRAVV